LRSRLGYFLGYRQADSLTVAARLLSRLLADRLPYGRGSDTFSVIGRPTPLRSRFGRGFQFAYPDRIGAGIPSGGRAYVRDSNRVQLRRVQPGWSGIGLVWVAFEVRQGQIHMEDLT